MIAHLLLTRFAVRLVRRPDQGPDSPAWLASRFALFERYCLPSVQAQTFGAFAWWIYICSGLPSEVTTRLQAYDSRIVLKAISPKAIPRVPDARVVVTTRLDSDDGIGASVMRQIDRQAQAFMRDGVRVPRLISFDRGYHVQHQRQVTYVAPGAAFKALIERQSRTGCRGVLSESCDTIASTYPTRSLRRPSWVRVVHGGNLVNRFKEQYDAKPVVAITDPEFAWLRAA